MVKGPVPEMNPRISPKVRKASSCCSSGVREINSTSGKRVVPPTPTVGVSDGLIVGKPNGGSMGGHVARPKYLSATSKDTLPFASQLKPLGASAVIKTSPLKDAKLRAGLRYTETLVFAVSPA